MLIRLTYASKVTKPITREDLRSILSASWENNASRNLTGMLCHGNDRFLQCLEGERDAVESLYAVIRGDPRHKDIILLEQIDIPARHFEDWSMGAVDVADDHVMAVIKGVTGRDIFYPEDLKQDQIIGLIDGLKSAIHPQFKIRPDSLQD